MVDHQEPGNIKDLRDAAERGRKATQELDIVKREMAFLKAGVDTESKAGQLLFKAYDGELETEAIQVEATELGILQAQPSESADDADRETGRQRQELVSDSVPPEHQSESPYDTGHREFQEMVAAGRPTEDAAARFVHTVLEAAGGASPDSRVLTDR